MSGRFDPYHPYHQWLGIAPKDQPPHYYRLLGIDLFEADGGVIDNAADRQMAHIRSCQTGKHADDAQQILNEIAGAKVCLLDADKRAAYDAHLRERLRQEKKVAAPLRVATPLESPAAVKPAAVAPTVHAPAVQHSSGGGGAFLIVTLVGAAALLMLVAGAGAVTYFWLRTDVPEVAAAPQDPAIELRVPAADDAPNNVTTNNTQGEIAARAEETNDAPTVDETNAPAGAPTQTSDAESTPSDVSDGAAATDATKEEPPADISNIALPPDSRPVATPAPSADDKPSPAVETSPPKDARRPVPAKTVRDDKRAQIAEIFQVSEASTPADRLTLATRLLDTGRESENDPAAQFTLFNTAREMALAGGDVRLAFVAIEQLHLNFQVNADTLKVVSLEEASNATVAADAKSDIVPLGIKMIDQFLAADEYEKAGALITTMQGIARKLRDRDGLAALVERRRRGAELYEAYTQAEAALAKLKDEPDDAAANLAAGKYLVFQKGQWERGLPLLAKGDNAAVKKIAELELSAPKTAATQQDLATAWWDAAGNERGKLQKLFRTRAAQWYREAAPKLTGLNAARATARLKEIEDAGINVPPLDEVNSIALATADSLDNSSPAPSTGNAGAAARAKGTIFAQADDSAELRLNGEEIGKFGHKNTTVIPVEVKIGDVLAVKAYNKSYEHGFRMCFRSEDNSRAFYSHVGMWGAYQPDDEAKWWEVDVKQVHSPAKLANINYLRYGEAHGLGAVPIWGLGATKGENSYMFHVVNENDLLEATEIDYPKLRRRGIEVKGTIHGCADDNFDLAINGLPVAGGGTGNSSTAVELQEGDVICVRAMNTQYEKGFMFVFESEDKSVKFGSNTATWGTYLPPDAQRWCYFNPLLGFPNASKGNLNYLNLKKDVALLNGAVPPVQAIWGPRNQSLVHMFHVVSESDLKKP